MPGRFAVAALMCASACGFQISGGTASDATPGDAVDAPDVDAAPLIDAPPDAAGTMVCPWPYTPPHVDPCGATPGGIGDLDLQMNGTYVLDTAGPTLRAPDASMIPLVTTTSDGARVVWTRVFRIGNGTTLRVIGALPLVLVSSSTITVDGTIDASSSWIGTTPARGAGSNPAACAPAGNGAQCSHGGSGGGGGGFGTIGGNGGFGGVNHDCVAGQDGEGISGGAGGATSAATLLRGGCNGGNGAEGNNPTPGVAGHGGGAVALVTRDALQINASGILHVGGSGGREASGGRSAGGGGGSGGMLSLAGTTIVVQSDAVLAANGGGGGGGANGGTATRGQDGKPASAVAVGGPKDDDGAAGGNGGFATTVSGGGANADRGGGGGGGGVGVIRLQTAPANSPQTSGAILSPPAS